MCWVKEGLEDISPFPARGSWEAAVYGTVIRSLTPNPELHPVLSCRCTSGHSESTPPFLNVQKPVLFLSPAHHMLATETNVPTSSWQVCHNYNNLIHPKRRNCSYSCLSTEGGTVDSACVTAVAVWTAWGGMEILLTGVCSFLPVSSQTTVSSAMCRVFLLFLILWGKKCSIFKVL